MLSWLRNITGEYLEPEPKDSRGYNIGLDFGVEEGSPVESSVDGVVVGVGWLGGGWGIQVKVRDADGNVHSYGHLSDTNVRVGDSVSAGDLLAWSGNTSETGQTTGPHLSYDVFAPDGSHINPHQFVDRFLGEDFMPEGDSEFVDSYQSYKEAERAWKEYQKANKAFADANGNVFRYENGARKIDQEGAMLYQAYAEAAQGLKNAEAVRGVLGTAQDAAKAYRDSEVLKSSEADRAYTNYVSRLENLQALEQVPLERFKAINTMRMEADKEISRQLAGNQLSFRGSVTLPGTGGRTAFEKEGDYYQGQAEGLRKTIPEQAPAFRPISSAALEPLPTGLKIPITPKPLQYPTSGYNAPTGGAGSMTGGGTVLPPEYSMPEEALGSEVAQNRLSTRYPNLRVNMPDNQSIFSGADVNYPEYGYFSPLLSLADALKSKPQAALRAPGKMIRSLSRMGR